MIIFPSLFVVAENFAWIWCFQQKGLARTKATKDNHRLWCYASSRFRFIWPNVCVTSFLQRLAHLPKCLQNNTLRGKRIQNIVNCQTKKKFSILTVQQKNPLTFIYAKNAPKWLIFPTLLMLCVDKKSVVICIFESCLACPPPRVRNSVHNMITLSPFTFAFTIIMTKATHVPIYIQIFRSLFIADCEQWKHSVAK